MAMSRAVPAQAPGRRPGAREEIRSRCEMTAAVRSAGAKRNVFAGMSAEAAVFMFGNIRATRKCQVGGTALRVGKFRSDNRSKRLAPDGFRPEVGAFCTNFPSGPVVVTAFLIGITTMKASVEHVSKAGMQTGLCFGALRCLIAAEFCRA